MHDSSLKYVMIETIFLTQKPRTSLRASVVSPQELSVLILEWGFEREWWHEQSQRQTTEVQEGNTIKLKWQLQTGPSDSHALSTTIENIAKTESTFVYPLTYMYNIFTIVFKFLSVFLPLICVLSCWRWRLWSADPGKPGLLQTKQEFQQEVERTMTSHQVGWPASPCHYELAKNDWKRNK